MPLRSATNPQKSKNSSRSFKKEENALLALLKLTFEEGKIDLQRHTFISSVTKGQLQKIEV